jgi:tRNA modification GTPase
MRAFMNGRFDLSQAEAVADIISSHSDASHNIAFKQFRGDFSKQIENLRQELLKFASLIELELDFAEEDVEFADRQKLDELVNLIISEISSLRKTFNQGNVIKQGIPVAISGRPNAGKSTLLNLLLHDERALVSNIPGTTRDALEEIISINGISFRFIDTAGLRQTDDEIEKMGINKTMQMLNKADVILYIADIPEVTTDDILSDIDELRKGIVNFEKKKLIIVGNKIDLMLEIPHGFNKLLASDMVFISAKRKENIELLEDKLLKIVQENKYEDGFVVSNTRHYEALMHTEDALKRVNQGLKNNISQDLLTSDIRDALFYLGTITGKITNDDILDSIFKNFCVGK